MPDIWYNSYPPWQQRYVREKRHDTKIIIVLYMNHSKQLDWPSHNVKRKLYIRIKDLCHQASAAAPTKNFGRRLCLKKTKMKKKISITFNHIDILFFRAADLRLLFAGGNWPKEFLHRTVRNVRAINSAAGVLQAREIRTDDSSFSDMFGDRQPLPVSTIARIWEYWVTVWPNTALYCFRHRTGTMMSLERWK